MPENLFPQSDVEALAAELRVEDPSLSIEQSMDAATAMLPDLISTIQTYNTNRVIEQGQLAIYASAWDSDVRAGVRISVTC